MLRRRLPRRSSFSASSLRTRYVIVEGTVVEATSPALAEAQEAIATRYLGEEGGREFARRLPRDDSVMFTIRPERWIAAEYSAG